ncbi:hypothetical protein BHYA_0034g00590 [Botrytis hyacinthi]|uniref:Uncharacterized protein n=1 Tax=Botrytis hyacinthi TaxID=278943 RepID=A0A4Z1GXV2_9HELO|nr:hypothetical protein BHYA_0034g00590 [Botrytis hyacinthi]
MRGTVQFVNVEQVPVQKANRFTVLPKFGNISEQVSISLEIEREYQSIMMWTEGNFSNIKKRQAAGHY